MTKSVGIDPNPNGICAEFFFVVYSFEVPSNLALAKFCWRTQMERAHHDHLGVFARQPSR